jgi:hypothetical protein
MATASPAWVTACRHMFNASIAPLVITISSELAMTPLLM